MSTLLPPIAASASNARAFTRAALHEWKLDQLRDDVTLIVSELVANAVTHTGSPVLLTLQADENVVRVEVRDDSTAAPMIALAEPMSERGRGLLIVAATAHRWGVGEAPINGKLVWADVLIPLSAFRWSADGARVDLTTNN